MQTDIILILLDPVLNTPECWWHCGKTQKLYQLPAPSETPVSCRQKNGAKIDVPCPEAVRLYNQFMSGVDTNDQLWGYYSVRTKCYKYIFWFLFDVASFILHQRVPAAGKMTLKEFRVELARQLIESYNSHKYCGRPSMCNSNSQRRKMHVPHYPTRASQGRCRQCSGTEGRTTTWYCNECQLRLCHTGEVILCQDHWHKSLPCCTARHTWHKSFPWCSKWHKISLLCSKIKIPILCHCLHEQ